MSILIDVLLQCPSCTLYLTELKWFLLVSPSQYFLKVNWWYRYWYNSRVIGSVPTRGNEIIIIIFSFSSLWYRGKAWRSLNMQCLQNSTETGYTPSSPGTECLNIRFPLPTLLCAGYNVTLKQNKKILTGKIY